MSKSISVYYYNMGLGLTYHKKIIYTKSDGSSVWVDSLRGYGSTIIKGSGGGIPPGSSGSEVISTTNEIGGLAQQWDIINDSIFDIYVKSLNPDSEWKYQWTYPFYNCNFMAD